MDHAPCPLLPTHEPPAAMDDVPASCVEWTITIQKTDQNAYRVAWGSSYVDGLAWDEMLGQIAYMTAPPRMLRSDKLPSLFHAKSQSCCPPTAESH